jgi:hypothetical protein
MSPLRYRQGFDQTRLWGRPESAAPGAGRRKRFAVLIWLIARPGAMDVPDAVFSWSPVTGFRPS